MTARNDDEPQQIHEALAKDQLYIHPSLESQFTAEQVAAIKENIADSSDPLFVVAYPFERGDAFSGSTADLLTRLHAEHPEPGIYLATTTSLEPTEISLEGRAWDVPSTSDGSLYHPALSIVRYESHETLGSAFERSTELLLRPASKLDKLESKARDEWYDRNDLERSSTGSSYGEDGFDPTGLVLAGLIAAIICAVIYKAFAGVRRAKKPQALPPSAMARIRKAHDRKLEQQARDDVLVLGERIDDSEITATGNVDSWQSALDHYEAARRAMDVKDPEVLDVVGAIVLADNGSRALDAALAGRSFKPPTRCFLNPLHGVTGQVQAVTAAGREIKAPLCTACRQALRRDRVPDILDVARRGKAVHYFETDSEPWASTGYGALEPDLIGRLHRRP
ncbi:MAG TPA: hypothetical protein VIR30_04955 [Nocardioides sp.]